MQFSAPYEWISARAQTHPATLCLEDDLGRRLDYAAVDQLAGRHGAVLQALGVRQGDRVALQVEKSLDGVLAYLACLRIGAVVVPLTR